MDKIHDLSFGGERPLFGAHDVCLENITITDGESGIKCCHDIECHDSKFFGKYPWWHVDRSLITSCYFAPNSRSAIWYSNDMVMKDCVIDPAKVERVALENAASIAGMFLTTECLIVDKPEEKTPAMPAGQPGMM